MRNQAKDMLNQCPHLWVSRFTVWMNRWGQLTSLPTWPHKESRKKKSAIHFHIKRGVPCKQHPAVHPLCILNCFIKNNPWLKIVQLQFFLLKWLIIRCSHHLSVRFHTFYLTLPPFYSGRLKTPSSFYNWSIQTPCLEAWILFFSVLQCLGYLRPLSAVPRRGPALSIHETSWWLQDHHPSWLERSPKYRRRWGGNHEGARLELNRG